MFSKLCQSLIQTLKRISVDLICPRVPQNPPNLLFLDPLDRALPYDYISSSSANDDSLSTLETLSDSILFESQTSANSTNKEHFTSETPTPVLDTQVPAIEKYINMFKELNQFGQSCASDKLISEVEALIALFLNISCCTSPVSVSSAAFLYTRKYMKDKSVTAFVFTCLNEMIKENGLSNQSSESTDSWLDFMRNVQVNWTTVKNNKLFSHFSKLLGLLVTFQLCDAASVTLSIKEFELFSPDLTVLHGKAIDVFDAALSTVTYFVENIYLCCKMGSLRPFLTNNKLATELDSEYMLVTSWWQLVKNGNLKKVKGTSDAEFDDRLEALTTKLQTMKNSMSEKASFEKKILSDKINALLVMKNDYITLKIASGVRKAPFAIELYGSSSQGKTTCGDQIVDALLTSAGLPTSKEKRATYNANDKYMSNWATNKQVLFIDDVANEKSNFVETPPTRTIIEVCNNQMCYANMAELDKKGKVFIEPALVIVNTNVKTMDANLYSNNPYSIQRRMHFVISVKAKTKYQHIVNGQPQGINSRAIREEYKLLGKDPMFDDIWELTVEKAVAPTSLSSLAPYRVVDYKGLPLKDVSFNVVLQFLVEEFHAHIEDQENILTRMSRRDKDLRKCPHDKCIYIDTMCPIHDSGPRSTLSPLENQSGYAFGDFILPAACTAGTIMSKKIFGESTGIVGGLDKLTSKLLMFTAKKFHKHWDWMWIVPTCVIQNEYFINLMFFNNSRAITLSFVFQTIMHIIIPILGALMLKAFLQLTYLTPCNRFYSCFVFVILCVLMLARQAKLVDIVKEQYREKLLKRNTISASIQSIRDEHLAQALMAGGVVMTLYGLSRLYRRWLETQPQGCLEPITPEQVKQRDSEDSPWTNIVKRTLPFSKTSMCSTSEQLLGLVSKNLVYIHLNLGDKGGMFSNAFFLKTNIVVVPNHYFDGRDDIDVTFRKENPLSCGGKFAARLSKLASFLVPNTDLRICYVPTGGSFRDLTPWFPEANPDQVEVDISYRNRDGSLNYAKALHNPGKPSNAAVKFFNGGMYSGLTCNTFQGMCGAVVTSSGKGSTIVGFHLGGISNTANGCYGLLTSSEITTAISSLEEIEGVLLAGSSGVFENQVLGVKILDDRPLHAKSALNWMPINSQVEYFGSCGSESTSISSVKVTPISHIVMNVMGSPNIYCGPKMRPEWFGWQKCLSNLSNPAFPYPHSLLAKAVVDYKRDLLPIFKSRMWCCTTPLTEHENVNGIPGRKFVDAIKLDTSIGFPLKGPKRPHVIENPPTEEHPCNREFTPEILEEIYRCENLYKKGERAYCIAKACKKDEVLSSAEKCRVFYGNPIALTFLIRKYFLPVMRVLQMNPLKAECAVGINSHGPEWDALHKFLFTFGENRLIGGDYSKYDQKIPSQLILASLRILIDFAKLCNYSEMDIVVMKALSADVVFAYVAFNGDLIGFTEGTHISGNSLTVIINGICGSLNQRAYFYTKFPQSMSFRDSVKLMTYGDDNIGSVKEDVDFTIKGLSEFLKTYGQVYTMPDKNSELKDFLPPEQFEFLKRKSVYCPKKGLYIGALIDKSIFKMLHCFLRPKGVIDTEGLASAKNIDTALREWANHGETIYESRRLELTKVAVDGDIRHMCTTLDVSYDEHVASWVEKYA